MKRPQVHLTIDRLVLRGVAPGDRAALVEALGSELRQQLSQPEGLAGLGGGRSVDRLRTDRLQVTGTGGGALGSAAGRAIEGALKR